MARRKSSGPYPTGRAAPHAIGSRPPTTWSWTQPGRAAPVFRRRPNHSPGPIQAHEDRRARPPIVVPIPLSRAHPRHLHRRHHRHGRLAPRPGSRRGPGEPVRRRPERGRGVNRRRLLDRAEPPHRLLRRHPRILAANHRRPARGRARRRRLRRPARNRHHGPHLRRPVLRADRPGPPRRRHRLAAPPGRRRLRRRPQYRRGPARRREPAGAGRQPLLRAPPPGR